MKTSHLMLCIALVATACTVDAGNEITDELGTASEDLTLCSSGTTWRRSDYKYYFNGKWYAIQISKNASGKIWFENRATDGSWWDRGLMNRWSQCPGAANETVRLDGVVNKNLKNVLPKSCTHVCLPDGREELHCPNGQFVMTRTARQYDCASQQVASLGCTELCDAQLAQDQAWCDVNYTYAEQSCLSWQDPAQAESCRLEAMTWKNGCDLEAIQGFGDCLSGCLGGGGWGGGSGGGSCERTSTGSCPAWCFGCDAMSY